MNEQRENGKIGGLAESLVIAFSMYSRIPMPMVAWTEKGMKYALCFFPAVGIAVGAAVAAFWQLSRLLGLGDLSRLCVETALPLLITGGIHMDGFLDTVDARSSHQSRERKLEILKDPHAGAFAIIGCGVYFVLYGALFSELDFRGCLLFAGTFAAERALSGMSVVLFPMARQDGLAASFSQAALKRVVRLVMAGYLAASAAFFLIISEWLFDSLIPGFLCLASSMLVFFWYYRMSVREFGGITGDLAGYFLQICELALLGASVLGVWIW